MTKVKTEAEIEHSVQDQIKKLGLHSVHKVEVEVEEAQPQKHLSAIHIKNTEVDQSEKEQQSVQETEVMVEIVDSETNNNAQHSSGSQSHSSKGLGVAEAVKKFSHHSSGAKIMEQLKEQVNPNNVHEKETTVEVEIVGNGAQQSETQSELESEQEHVISHHSPFGHLGTHKLSEEKTQESLVKESESFKEQSEAQKLLQEFSQDIEEKQSETHILTETDTEEREQAKERTVI